MGGKATMSSFRGRIQSMNDYLRCWGRLSVCTNEVRLRLVRVRGHLNSSRARKPRARITLRVDMVAEESIERNLVPLGELRAHLLHL